jgi:putative sugar O-methyltransferase
MPNIGITLDSEKVNRLKEYLSWTDSKDSTESDYWKKHSSLISVKFDKNSVLLSGESGFYFPRELNLPNRFRNFFRLSPTRLSNYIFKGYRNLFSKPIDFLRTPQSAYENIWKRDPVTRRNLSSKFLGCNELNNEILNFRTIKGMKRKWVASKTHILSDVIIKSYFYLQLLESTIQELRGGGSTVCEIGPGTGNLSSLFFYHFNTKLFLVDLPRTILFSFSYLSQSFPNAKILLPNEIDVANHELSEYDIIMMTPDQTSIIPDGTVDLTVNVHSMQEMVKESIDFYFEMIDRVTKPGGYFFSSNRVEKIMDGQPNRFSEYPWRPYTRTVFFEIDPLHRLVQLDPLFIRLEQYPKVFPVT